ncbi:hypothetical protein CAPTEDRAFT_171654 [Capitella teleta]|uniref:Glyoxylate reductase/hydroxypyruvate reductase n=1 Tax=Capitella teleta TaxID=283909 RepID=R7VJW0_CAPTE|nr:hypothetical protein CAPTEDRAFT_171654 [Capitella teleta]|eukprot:ELU16240.1 hypothetical protein CAPTEDRAFT_171654 [Capitella teleta]
MRLASALFHAASRAMPSVYITRRVPPRGLSLLQQRQMQISQWDSDAPVPQDELMKGVVGKDALFCLLTDKIDKNVIQAAGPQLKVIGTMSVGYEHIDLAECKSRGIIVGYTPDVLTDATAELTVALLLATSRRIVEGAAAVKSGEWSTWAPLWMCGPGLHGATVGVVGLGRIGMATARRLRPFGIQRLIYTGRSEKAEAKEVDAEFVSFEALLQQSDFVIATCPLNEQTKGLFNMKTFSQMKRSAIFINSSRGGVVDQDDLYTALNTRLIGAAGLDVTVPEPLPPSHPLLSLANCVVLPHIGSANNETRNTMSALTAQNIIAAVDGKALPAQLTLP